MLELIALLVSAGALVVALRERARWAAFYRLSNQVLTAQALLEREHELLKDEDRKIWDTFYAEIARGPLVVEMELEEARKVLHNVLKDTAEQYAGEITTAAVSSLRHAATTEAEKRHRQNMMAGQLQAGQYYPAPPIGDLIQMGLIRDNQYQQSTLARLQANTGPFGKAISRILP